MIKLSGMWINESKSGEKFFSGNLGSGRIVLLKNTFKEEGNNEPDYNLYIEEQVKKVVPKLKDEDVPF